MPIFPRRATALLAAALLAALPCAAGAQGHQRRPPVINPEYPTGGHLSPPLVAAVNACSKHVYVSGFVPRATVKVYRNAALVASVVPDFGFADVPVPALVAGDHLTATQTVFAETSAPTTPVTVVGVAPASLAAPVVDMVIYSCGRIVPVHGLVPGVTVDVRDLDAGGATIGTGDTPNLWGSDWAPVWTTPLVTPHRVAATQTSCSSVTSPLSAAVPVLPEPSPLLAPTLDPPVVGNDAVTAHGLYTGALLEVLDHGAVVGAGYATGGSNWQKLAAPIAAGAAISVRQSLCHHSPATTPVPPVSTLPPPVVLGPICPGDGKVKVRGTVINANVVLFRNGAVVGYGGAAPGDVTLAFAPPAVAAAGDAITALQYIGGVVSVRSAPVYVNCFRQNVVTQHNDNARTGAQLAETVLTPANVSGPSFGLLYDRAVNGTLLAQPLYVHGVRMPGRSLPRRPVLRNLVLVATSRDVVYAFDADDTRPDSVVGGESKRYVWRRQIGTPHVGDICAETFPGEVGVTSTPVIDVSAGRMYVVERDQHGETGMGEDVLHVLRISDGADLDSVVVGATAPAGDGTAHFHPGCQRQRPGLLLQNGNVYLGYGTYSCDAGCPNGEPYRGWIIGYRASDLAPAGAFTNSSAPNEGGMGVWASGNGLAGNADGTAIFYETGNDLGGAGLALNGDAFVKLTSSPATLTFAARYQPANAGDLRAGDTDLGSGGPLLLPGGRLVGGGKDGRLFVLPQSDLTTGATAFQAFVNSFHLQAPYGPNFPPVYPNPCPPAPPVGQVANPDQPCWIDPALYPKGEAYGPNIHGAPVYWATDRRHGLVYKMPEKDYLKAFAYDASTGTLSTTPAAVAPVRPAHDGMPGGFSSISAQGTQNGIVWTVVQQLDGQWGPATPAILYAFDARTLAVLWSNAGPDQAAFAKFNSPTIADGRVFLPSVNHFQVYGLRPSGMSRLHLSLADLMRQRWGFLGGTDGTLGKPLAEFRRGASDPGGGTHVDFVQDVPGGGYGNISLPADVKIVRPMCARPETQVPIRIVSSMYASPATGAWVVRGEIRRVWLERGGVQRFGYPVSDEVPTADGLGLMTRFQRGTLRWYEGREVIVEPADTQDPARQPVRRPEQVGRPVRRVRPVSPAAPPR